MAKDRDGLGKVTLTPEFRMSFVHLFETVVDMQDRNVYEITMLFPKNTDLSILKTANSDLIKNKFPDEATRKQVIQQLRNPFRDGDLPNGEGNIYDGYPGNWYVRAWTKSRPKVIDSGKMDILDSSEIYSGCWGRATIQPFYYNTKGNKGISYFINVVQKIRDDDQLGDGGRRSIDEFDVVVAGANDPANYVQETADFLA